MFDLSHRAHQLLLEQQRCWEMLRLNYHNLTHARTRQFDFDGFTIKVQLNPGRLASSSARVDEQSIRQRPCFLCAHNRPPEQRGIACPDGFVLLCNPYPILPDHFTIVHEEHRPQQIADSFAVMLHLARAMSPRYVLLYNGARAGASCPDHMHFQAGTRGVLPYEQEHLRDDPSSVVWRGLHIRFGGRFLRPFVSFQCDDASAIARAFARFHESYQAVTNQHDEPMMNIHCSFDAGQWRVIVFPRARHRPSFCLAGGDEKILLSPAAIDLGGLCITPVQRDFERLTKDHIVRMFEEVCISRQMLRQIVDRIGRL